jgi:cell division GTPase FtsZ
VEDALNFLQDEAGNNAEIVLGVNIDERLEDKVEVILVITGLGAIPLEQSIPGFKPAQTSKKAEPVESAAFPAAQMEPLVTRRLSDVEHERVPSNSSNDLDLPAFLRRSR